MGQAVGAVLSRKAYAVTAAAGWSVDGGSAAFQRIVGGLALILVVGGWMWGMRGVSLWRPSVAVPGVGRRAAVWVLGNSVLGPAAGVSCFQWALRVAPSGVVLPVLAATPLAVMPLAWWLEADRPGLRSLLGGALAVAGGVLLAMQR